MQNSAKRLVSLHLLDFDCLVLVHCLYHYEYMCITEGSGIGRLALWAWPQLKDYKTKSVLHCTELYTFKSWA